MLRPTHTQQRHKSHAYVRLFCLNNLCKISNVHEIGVAVVVVVVENVRSQYGRWLGVMTTMATQNLQALSDKDPRNLPPGNVAEVPLDPDTVYMEGKWHSY